MSFAKVLVVPFFVGSALPFDDVARAGNGLSLFDVELCESDLGFSPFVVESLLDLRLLRSAGILIVNESLALGKANRRRNHSTTKPRPRSTRNQKLEHTSSAKDEVKEEEVMAADY